MSLLFKSIYQPEIDKLLNFMENAQQRFCLVTSFGSNGKSFLHRILQKEGEQLWKVSMRDLINPTLNYPQIELYLQWLFTNSPYPVLFLDDLDVICPKVEEGDSLKKKGKVISRLVLKRINRLSQLHCRKIVATARSESALDETFRAQLVVALKNPSREQREEAMKSVHVVVMPDDSPIHKVKSPNLHRRKVTI